MEIVISIEHIEKDAGKEVLIILVHEHSDFVEVNIV